MTITMPTAPLGDSGLHASRLGLGTMTFGVETEERDAFAQLDRFVAAGGTLIDTADVYADGESERMVGRWLREHPAAEVVVATKGRFAPPPGSSGGSRRALTRAVDASLARLGLDAIDLYLVHGWDQAVPVEETLATLTDLVARGKLHHVGWSNVTGWQLAEIVTTARLAGLVRPCVLQAQHNLLDRGVELDVLPCCLDHGLSSMPWSPLGGGWLTGKYGRDRPTGDTRLGDDPDRGVEAYDKRAIERTWDILEVVERIARAHGVPMGQVAVAWLLTRPTVATVLLGARTDDQLAQILPAVELRLTSDDVAQLTSATTPQLPDYPHGVVETFSDVPHWRTLGVR
jgi:aryl-alcohol dehydrogenase-like predicted oxidoreductase